MVAGLLLLAAPTAAQTDFFRNSPGPLSTAHEPWDHSDRCAACHQLGAGVTNSLCLKCHDHQALGDAIARGQGLHAKFTEPCRGCHTEHKGRAHYITDWSALGGQARFAHERTGFALSGQHASVPCSACHQRRLKSGRTSFLGLKPGCNACHQNPHKFSDPELNLTARCTLCHVPGVKGLVRASNIPFDHGKVAGLPLVGKHGVIACVECHARGNMAKRSSARTCSDCHKSRHGKAIDSRTCQTCHSPERKWTSPSFNHDTTTFLLRGKHAEAACAKCHTSAEAKPRRPCSACHKDPHAKRFGAITCEDCHAVGGLATFGALHFDHAKRTRFPLVARHDAIECRACHRGKSPADFERFASSDCKSCHRHANAHRGQFANKKCTECHEEGGNKALVFNHNKDARFPLSGFHARAKCTACHPSGAYRTGKLKCLDCHKDSHSGKLGEACERCHTAEVKFASFASAFDHNRLAKFDLEGLHTKVKCEKCHPERTYKTGKARCVDCHRDDDPHKGKLGAVCENCHTPDKGATRFNHGEMTDFARDGAHLNVACSFCHRVATSKEPPPKIGWTRGLAASPVNKLFPVMGQRCFECHRDPHEGRYGPGCDSCHNTLSFKRVTAAVHDTGAFRLSGVHDTLPCPRCHEPQLLLAGAGELCQLCHQPDDAHNNALGPMCGDCHSQLDWLPAHFSHTAQTGFALVGAHALAPCDDCHGIGTYAGTPESCDFCHFAQAARVSNPVHTAGAFMECTWCHTQVSFSPAKRYHPWYALSGRHALVGCRSCHGAGVYAGTSIECIGCHNTSYLDPGNQPNHLLALCPPTCEDCHSPAGWTPARARCPGE